MSQFESKALEKLNEAEELMKKELQEIDEINGDIEERKKEIEEAQAEKEEQLHQLEKLVQELHEETEHIQKLTSSSRDARKMYGDMTPGDTTHSDVTLAYQNHFKDAHRNMPKKLDMKEGNEKYEVWKTCGDTMEECFEKSREEIVDKMELELKETLESEHETLTEEKYDLQRAFMMLFANMKEDELQTITEEVKKDDPGHDKETDYIMEMLKVLKPNDYIHFIKTGKPKIRKATDIQLSQ